MGFKLAIQIQFKRRIGNTFQKCFNSQGPKCQTEAESLMQTADLSVKIQVLILAYETQDFHLF